MARIITVHGTNDTGPAEGDQWWQRGSFFEQDIRRMVEADDGSLEFEPVIWDGLNSETSRRFGAEKLREKIERLEREGIDYTVVGHSHGGSIIASALIQSVVRRQPTGHLKSWITIGTPFVRLRKEYLLFSRIPTYQKSIFVGFLSLVLMFLTMFVLKLIYGPSEVLSGLNGLGGQEAGHLVQSLATSLMVFLSIGGAFLVFYLVLYFMDARKFRYYRRGEMAEADRRFSQLWISLTHEDDEAVRGLSSLGSAKVPIFHKEFAIPLFASAAVFVLPAIYFMIIFSPSLSTNVTKVVTRNLYYNSDYSSLAAQEFKKRAEVAALREDLSGVVASIIPDATRRRNGRSQPTSDPDGSVIVSGRGETRRRSWSAEDLEARRKQFQQRRAEIEAKATPEQKAKMVDFSARLRQASQELKDLRRVQSFKQNFLDDQGNILASGRNPAKNSELIFRVFTSEVENLFKDVFDQRMVRRSWYVEAGSFMLIFLVMPMFFAVLSLAILYAFRFLAYRLSGRISAVLDAMTWGELRRAAFGNDTISEVAITSLHSPQWCSKVPPCLPEDIAQQISDRSNAVAASSLAKLRNAISELAFSERSTDHSSVISEYITWHELIHTTYFHVPAFRKLLAYALTQSGGFKATEDFKSDPDYARVADWYSHLMGPETSGA